MRHPFDLLCYLDFFRQICKANTLPLQAQMMFENDIFQFGNIMLRFGSSSGAMKKDDVGCKTVTTTEWISKTTVSTQ